MGDIVTLVEKAQASFDEAEAKRLEKKVRKEGMDLNDFLNSMRQIQKMGPLEGILKMLPGVNTKVLQQAKQADPRRLRHLEAIVLAYQEKNAPPSIDQVLRARAEIDAGTPAETGAQSLDL